MNAFCHRDYSIIGGAVSLAILHRLHHDKKEVRVYDYVDSLVPMLARMYKKRLAGYQAIGYSVANADPIACAIVGEQPTPGSADENSFDAST